MTATAAIVELRRNPDAAVRADDFVVARAALPALADGQVRVRNRWMSIDPYMRLAIGSQAGYLPRAEPGDTMRGAAIGTVEESRADGMAVGSAVLSQMGWRTAFVASAAEVVPVDAAVPGPWLLGALGLTGVTAWLGVETVLEPARGETIFVSGAAGAVGSIACQLAKRRGARVLGSAGSDAKVAWLRDEVGIDAAFNYRQAPLAAMLAREAPEGLDCCFDNIGGETLDGVLQAMKPHGRVGLCGAISQYQSGDYRSGPSNFFSAIERSLRLEGFNAFLLSPEQTRAIGASLHDLLRSGELKPLVTIVHGLDAVPAAFERLFGDGFLGKAVVALDA